MQSEDAKYLKRKIRSRAIDVHPTEQALVVSYELEALILGDLGDPLLGDKKECQKIIRLKSLTADTDCAALAKQVVEQCSLIHPTKLEELEHLIQYLQSRQPDTGSSPPPPGVPVPESLESQAEKTSITDVEEYVELLYEDIDQKVKGSAFILHLARNPDNLYELGNNESVLSALARVLREDWKQSIDLATNIVYIFFCFSKYSAFHNIILQCKVGSLCMEVIDSELRRYDQLKDDLEMRRGRMDNGGRRGADGGEEAPRRGGVSHIPVRGKNAEAKDEIRGLKEDFESRKQKFEYFVRKQDQLMRVCFFLLLNIAEDVKVEDKMRKKNIAGMLVKTLDRSNPDLLILVVTFLKKLSVFRENVDDMRDLNAIELMPRVLTLPSAELVDVTLGWLFNMSFDLEARERMIRVGFLPRFVSLMGIDRHRLEVLKLLYHFSMDDKCKSMFVYTDCIPLAMDMLLRADCEPDVELIALCVNLAVNQRNAQLMVENNRLQLLMEKAFRGLDSMLMKVVRNVSQHDSTKLHFVEFVGDIAKAIVTCDNEDFVAECVGILGNLSIPDLDFRVLMNKFDLVPWILNVLVPGKYEDQLVLDVVVLLGTAAADQGCAELLCKADVLFSLIDLLNAKQEDDEMVLQVVFLFYQICCHAATRDFVVKETDAPAYFVDLMHDKNTHISAMCNACLDIIGEQSAEWAERTKLERFRFHNSQWLEMVENSSGDLGEDDLPAYQSHLLENSGHNTLYAESYPLESSPGRPSSCSSSEDVVLGPRLSQQLQQQ